MKRSTRNSVIPAISIFALAPVLTIQTALAEPRTEAETMPARIGAFENAAALLEKQAKQGNIDSQYQLASIYRIGRGVRQDDNLAFSWMQKAAQGGHVRAQYSLATMYLAGRGVATDLKQAELWAKRAAAKGHHNAVLLIAEIAAKVDRPAQISSLIITTAERKAIAEEGE